MKSLKQLALAAAATIALAGAAEASDLYTAVPSTPGWAPATGSDFEGFYFGVQKGWWWTADAFSFNKVAGVNFVLGDNFLVGAEVMGGVVTDFSDIEWEAYLRGRAGVLLDDQLLLYKVVEVGNVGGDAVWGLGGGIEFMASDNMSIRGEVRGLGEWGNPWSEAVASIGFLWHFN
jgi:outer membrane immunogenic protein